MRATPRTIRAIVCLVVAAGVQLALPGLSAQTRSVSVTQALDMYERGDRVVISGLTSIQNHFGLYEELRRKGVAWAKAKGREEEPRRRLVLAAFALEAARSGGTVPLIEFVCDQLRPPKGSKTPLPAERHWHEAALAVIQARGTYADIETHLWHLNTRFKDEPMALLARGWMKQAEWEAIPRELSEMPSAADLPDLITPDMRAASRALMRRGEFQENRLDRANRPGLTSLANDSRGGVVLPQLPRADLASSIWTAPDVKWDVGRRVIREYEKALTSPGAAPEAHLRIGYLQLVSGQTDKSLMHLREVPALTSDPSLRYLTHLFTGWAEERADHLGLAEAAYRRALAVLPSGRTAATWLATLLQSQGKLEDAQALIDASLALPQRTPDPWPLFGQGEFRRWPVLIEQLRTALWSDTASRPR